MALVQNESQQAAKTIVKKESFVLYMLDNLKSNIYFCNFYEHWVPAYKSHHIKHFHPVYFIATPTTNITNWQNINFLLFHMIQNDTS